MAGNITSSIEKDLGTVFLINRAVEIEVQGDETIDHYRSTVSDLDGKIIALAMPMRSTNYVRLEAGLTIVVMAAHHDALYAVRCHVLSSIIEPIPIVLVRAEGDIQRLQRRRHVRVETFLPQSSILVQQGKAEEWHTITAPIMSLSCGGLLFRSSEKLTPNTDVQVTFQLDDDSQEPVRLSALIVRTEEDTICKPSVYFVGCSFTSVPRLVEKRLMNYVFKRQIEMRRRGLV